MNHGIRLPVLPVPSTRRPGAHRSPVGRGVRRALRAAFGPLALVAALVVVPSWAPAHAQDAPTSVMGEPVEYTNVLDAFEQTTPFDFAAHVGYRYLIERARIEREQPTLSGRQRADFVPVADADRRVKQLVLALDLGLYRDIMLSVRLPFVLSDRRQLRWTRREGSSDTASVALAALFPTERRFDSKPRDGLPGIELGLRWGLTNQFRDPQLPTWVLLADLQLGTGEAAEACAAGGDCSPGLTDGTSSLRTESRFSYRYRYAEPYLGVHYLYRYVAAPGEQLYGATESRDSSAAPPNEVGLTAGVAVVPWEDRGRFQRFTLDVRGQASAISAGRALSPLFDVIGTSPALSDQTTGATDVEARARLGLDTALLLRAARYVRFRAALEVRYDTPYLITGAPHCSGEIQVDPGVGGLSGSCGDAPFLPVLDLPGQRFRVEHGLSYGLSATAVGQF